MKSHKDGTQHHYAWPFELRQSRRIVQRLEALEPLFGQEIEAPGVRISVPTDMDPSWRIRLDHFEETPTTILAEVDPRDAIRSVRVHHGTYVDGVENLKTLEFEVRDSNIWIHRTMGFRAVNAALDAVPREWYQPTDPQQPLTEAEIFGLERTLAPPFEVF